MRIEQEFGCLGYYGFGGGVAMARKQRSADAAIYCQSRCPLVQDCWRKHRERVKELFPESVALLERFIDGAGGRGDLGVKRFVERYGSEPYIAVMLGNLEDGAAVEHGEMPKDRGPGTITDLRRRTS